MAVDVQLGPHLVAGNRRAQDVEPEVGDLLEHERPVPGDLVGAAEPGLRMERLLAPVVLVEAFPHTVDVVVVRGRE
jgi:hypothetical protein